MTYDQGTYCFHLPHRDATMTPDERTLRSSSSSKPIQLPRTAARLYHGVRPPM